MSLMIEGGRRLSGDLTVQGAKNSVLPILAACILSGDVCVLQRCPHLEDVDTSIDILRHLGCAVRWNGPDLEVDSSTLTRWDIPDRLMRRMRSSVVFLGAILARCGQAELSYPGGCAIGARPIDLHLSALRTLGACIREEGVGGSTAKQFSRVISTQSFISQFICINYYMAILQGCTKSRQIG